MADSCTIVIGAADLLPLLRDRISNNGEVLTFAEADTLHALDAINTRRPDVVALERMFAATSRGAALINRIKADPSLDACEILVIAHDNNYVHVSRRARGRSAARSPAPPAVPPPAPVAAAPIHAVPIPAEAVAAKTAHDLDFHGTRRAPRVRIRERVEVLVDGNPATLVNLSATGAQVLSTAVLRPNQRVRITLHEESGAVRFNGSIAWASFELSRANPNPQYRAGVEFTDADRRAVDAFCSRYRRDA